MLFVIEKFEKRLIYFMADIIYHRLIVINFNLNLRQGPDLGGLKKAFF